MDPGRPRAVPPAGETRRIRVTFPSLVQRESRAWARPDIRRHALLRIPGITTPTCFKRSKILEPDGIAYMCFLLQVSLSLSPLSLSLSQHPQSTLAAPIVHGALQGATQSGAPRPRRIVVVQRMVGSQTRYTVVAINERKPPTRDRPEDADRTWDLGY
jgi:hypothetical protein